MLKLLRGVNSYAPTKSSTDPGNASKEVGQKNGKEETSLVENSPNSAPRLPADASPAPVVPTPAVGDAVAQEVAASDDDKSSKPTPFPTPEEPEEASSTPGTPVPPTGVIHRIRRMSFRSFGFFYGRSTANVATGTDDESTADVVEEPAVVEVETSPTPAEESETSTPAAVPEKLKKSRRAKKADKRASSYALLLRAIIIGSPLPPEYNSANARSKIPLGKPKAHPMKKLKSELLKPKEANRLIAEVRNLPTPDTSKGVLHGTIRGLNGKMVEQDFAVVPSGSSPIHAVCLDCTDDAADALHFSQLTSTLKPQTTVLSLTPSIAQTDTIKNHRAAGPNIAQADLTSVIPMLRNLKIIDLVSQSVEVFVDHVGSPANDFGLGRPPSEPGILAGAVPSSDALAQGALQAGKELLNLGFATSAAVVPNHEGVYPPTDRVSVLSYWWGYEVVLPEPTVKYLGTVSSIQHTMLNFLTAFSIINNGVREVLPFVRYASQFIDFEWNAIKSQDKGKGVVCAATWIMPAALVPRPWDFAPPPKLPKSGPTAKMPGNNGSSDGFLPGTEIILSPTKVAGAGITPSGSTPMVTLSPPEQVDIAVGTE